MKSTRAVCDGTHTVPSMKQAVVAVNALMHSVFFCRFLLVYPAPISWLSVCTACGSCVILSFYVYPQSRRFSFSFFFN